MTNLSIIGRAACGCVVAIDFEGLPESEQRYLKQGYQVSHVTHSEARVISDAMEYPCLHKRQAISKK